MQAVKLSIAHEYELAAVKSRQGGAMADGHDGGVLEPRVEQEVNRGFRRLIEGGRGLVEEKIVRRVQEGAGNAETLLLPSDNIRFQCASSAKRPASAGSPTAVRISASTSAPNVPGAAG